MLRLSAKVVALLAFFLTHFMLYGALLFAVTDGLHLSPLPLVRPWTAVPYVSLALCIPVALASYRGTVRLARLRAVPR